MCSCPAWLVVSQICARWTTVLILETAWTKLLVYQVSQIRTSCCHRRRRRQTRNLTLLQSSCWLLHAHVPSLDRTNRRIEQSYELYSPRSLYTCFSLSDSQCFSDPNEQWLNNPYSVNWQLNDENSLTRLLLSLWALYEIKTVSTAQFRN